jgi:hypothetical protein
MALISVDALTGTFSVVGYPTLSAQSLLCSPLSQRRAAGVTPVHDDALC